jgi:hypothetical protein
LSAPPNNSSTLALYRSIFIKYTSHNRRSNYQSLEKSDTAAIKNAPKVLEVDEANDVPPSHDTQTSIQAKQELENPQADNIQAQPPIDEVKNLQAESEDESGEDEDDNEEEKDAELDLLPDEESEVKGTTKLPKHPPLFPFHPTFTGDAFGGSSIFPSPRPRSPSSHPTTAGGADQNPTPFGDNNPFTFSPPHQTPRPIPVFPSTGLGKIGSNIFFNEKPLGTHVETKITKARGYIDGSRLYIGRPAPSSLEEIDVFLTISDIGYHTVLQRPLTSFEQATEASSAKQGKSQDAGRTIRKPLWFQRHKRPVAIVNDDEVARLDDDRFFWVPVYPKPDVAQDQPQHLHHTTTNPSGQLQMNPADSVPVLKRTLRIEFETKLAALRSDLERKIADIGRENVRVLQLEIMLKQSEEAKEEYRKRLWGCERRFGRWNYERKSRRWRCRRRPRIRNYRRRSGRRSRIRSMG